MKMHKFFYFFFKTQWHTNPPIFSLHNFVVELYRCRNVRMGS